MTTEAFGFKQLNPAVDKRGTEEENERPEADEREKEENSEESSCIWAHTVRELFATFAVASCESQTSDPRFGFGHRFLGWFDGVV